MLSLFGKKDKTKKKSQIKEEWDIVHNKVPCIYKKIDSINSDLVQITNHKVVLSNQKKTIVTDDFDSFYEQISNILVTINTLENVYGLEKLEFYILSSKQ